MPKPIINAGEHRCKKCKGRGTVLAKDDPTTLIWLAKQRVPCPICGGKGKVDWIEQIVGVNKKTKVNWID